MAGDSAIFDRKLMVRRRDRFAADAGRLDFLLQVVAQDLAERLSLVRRDFPLAVNLGAYHGIVSRRLRGLPQVGLLIDVEQSPRLLAQCAGPLLCADEELLPFRTASLDLIVSALALQLCNDLPGALIQIRRALKPDGLMMAALLGGRTLHELREAFLIAEGELEAGASPHVAPFADVRDLGNLLQRADLALPVADTEMVTVHYPTPLDLMRELRAMGGGNLLLDRRKTPMRRRTLVRAAEIYTERYARADGRVRASFEIITLAGWAPHATQQQPLRPGSAQSRLADALGTVEQRAGRRSKR